MATKLEIRNYATANGISTAQARAHFIEQAKQRDADDSYTCKLFIKKYDTRDGSTEFQFGQVGISKKPYGNRNDLISSLGFDWKHDDRAFLTVAAYLSHSPSLHFAVSNLNSTVMMSNSGIHEIDLDNLGCVIEFTADEFGVSTNGPQWMSPSDVDAYAKVTAAQYAKTHDIKRHENC
jgi:hypothetical protein